MPQTRKKATRRNAFITDLNPSRLARLRSGIFGIYTNTHCISAYRVNRHDLLRRGLTQPGFGLALFQTLSMRAFEKPNFNCEDL
jgi:hypothetical protein